MAILKIKSAKKNEKGIALVFTLIVLALLLILALGFALSSMFNQKAARNAANASFAGFLGQTQLKEVLSLIENDEANLENSELYSHDSGSPAVTDTDMLKDMLNERLPVPSLLDTIDTAKVNWNYIRSKDSAQRIIGRTAFVVIAEGIPLGSLVDGRAGTTAYPKHDEELDTETRIGKYVSEINVRHAVPDTVTILGGSTAQEVKDMTAALNWQGVSANNAVPGFDGGKYTGKWTDFKSLFAVIETAIASSLSAADKAEFQKNLSLIVFKDKEAFWADIEPAGAPDGKISSNELYKRFDLTRNWDTADNAADLAFIKDKILLTTGTTPDIDMEVWNDTDSTTGSKGLPWLAAFGYKNDGTLYTLLELNSTFSTVSAHRSQIAANLKDYCDSGDSNRPTSDEDPTGWSGLGVGIHPTFTGNERTPYINEVGVCVIAQYVDGGGVGPSYAVKAGLEIRGYVELINIYGADWPADLEVVIQADVKFIPTIGNLSASPEESKSIDVTVAVGSGTWNNGYSNLAFTADLTHETTEDLTTVRSIKVEVTEVKIKRVVLRPVGGSGYDYVKTLTKTSTLEILNGNGTGRGWYCWAVHDPRQNLNSGDWKELDPPVATAGDTPGSAFSTGVGTAANFTIAGPNPTEAPTTGDGLTADKESATDPANGSLSTAFIRNAPMESPWELGFIHRGVRWQTVNLKIYDTNKAFQVVDIGGKNYIPGGGAYASGDANILDQIKMTEKAESPQKINLKSQKIEVFEALFAKIKYGCVFDSTMSVNSMAGLAPLSGTELTGAQTTFFGNKIINKYNTITNPDERRTRASAVNTLLLPELAAVPAIAADTDAKQEELIGKVINLTEIGGKVSGFTIVILAQMIKDIGGSAGNPINISKYSDDTTASNNRNCEISTFDADINDINDSKKNIYYDEITAEQKIIVKGCRTNDGSTIITSFQYVD